MMRVFTFSVVCAGLMALAHPVQAGWVVEWSNSIIRPDGQTMPADNSTMQIQGNKVRLTQPHSVTLIDYKKDTFTIMNPDDQTFWSGTVDQYGTDISEKRQAVNNMRLGRRPKAVPKTPTIDESKLPAITVHKTDETKSIAGHNTAKYEVFSAGENFQQMWVADDIDMSSDLDADKFLAYQLKMSSSMQGQAGERFQALFRNDDYKKLVSKGFALQIVTKHIAGGFERSVTAIRREDVPASAFDVPDNYRRVALSDVLPKPPTPVPAAPNQSQSKPVPALPPGARVVPKAMPGTR